MQLGVLLGVAATKFKRDKVTLIVSPGIADLGAWLEQLIAESTGKQGNGLVPVDLEPVIAADRYSDDRVFAYVTLQNKEDQAQAALVGQLEKLGHPVARIMVKDPTHLGAEFFRWEIATAVTGSVLGINPFDQPDVEASKIKTRALTDEVEKTGKLPTESAFFEADGVKLFAKNPPSNAGSLTEMLRALFGGIKDGDYVALLAYVERDAEHTKMLTELRRLLLQKRGNATCLGFGPRFLHSTGQAYKGGPNTGVFIQITTDHARDLDVPGKPYSFATVEAAQARGDLQVLDERDRRTLRVHLSDVGTGLKTLKSAFQAALA